MRSYITLETVADELGVAVEDDAITDPDTGARVTARTIASASRAVDSALFSAVYRTDSDGFPTDPSIRELLDEATLVQVLALFEGDKAGKRSASLSPIGRPLASASILGASYTADTAAPLVATPGRAVPADGSLCAEALAILASSPRLDRWIGVY